MTILRHLTQHDWDNMAATATGLDARISTIENKAKATNVPNVSTTPSAPVVEVLGVSVGSGGGMTNLRAAFIELRDSHNALLAAARSWGWMAAS